MSSHAALLIGLLIGLILTAAVGIDAHSRGRSGFLWGLLTLFTGLIGAFIYALIVLAGDDSETEKPDSVRVCPNCSATHSDAPDYCSECGEPLTDDDEAPTATILRSGSHGYCSNCHTRVQFDTNACPECGAQL